MRLLYTRGCLSIDMGVEGSSSVISVSFSSSSNSSRRDLRVDSGRGRRVFEDFRGGREVIGIFSSVIVSGWGSGCSGTIW